MNVCFFFFLINNTHANGKHPFLFPSRILILRRVSRQRCTSLKVLTFSLQFQILFMDFMVSILPFVGFLFFFFFWFWVLILFCKTRRSWKSGRKKQTKNVRALLCCGSKPLSLFVAASSLNPMANFPYSPTLILSIFLVPLLLAMLLFKQNYSKICIEGRYNTPIAKVKLPILIL